MRWDFIFQRPQHLLTRFGKHQRVFYVEEPVCVDTTKSFLKVENRPSNINLVIPHLPHGLSESEISRELTVLVGKLLREFQIENYLFWYYTPLALKFTLDFNPAAIVYDCMDELSAFKFAHSSLPAYENQMMRLADVVFTGGHSLFEAKKDRHANIYPVPSSIEKSHFEKARTKGIEPADQNSIPHPRLGYYGAVDERIDYDVIDALAAAHPEWNLVIIGPVVKVDPAALPRRANIHYLGGKSYSELPGYIAGWDVALLPFALNESTRFISPTKTPEYLAAGKPAVSSAIRDVIRPYGEKNFVAIANNAAEFISACEDAMVYEGVHPQLVEVDELLDQNSWDQTWEFMANKISAVLPVPFGKHRATPHPQTSPGPGAFAASSGGLSRMSVAPMNKLLNKLT